MTKARNIIKSIEQADECENCRFSYLSVKEIQTNVTEEDLNCRRYPPTIIYLFEGHGSRINISSGYPDINPDHWCGEWRKKEK